MTKLLEFPKRKNNMTWAEAMQAMLDNADENTKNTVIRNMLIVTEDKNDYSFGLLNELEMRSMLGTVECVRHYFLNLLQEMSEYKYDDRDDFDD